MMLRWTEHARADLREIREFIGKDSKVYARRMIERLREAVERLRRFPSIGSQIEEWRREPTRLQPRAPLLYSTTLPGGEVG